MNTMVIYIFHADNGLLSIRKVQEFMGRGWTLQYACDAFAHVKTPGAV